MLLSASQNTHFTHDKRHHWWLPRECCDWTSACSLDGGMCCSWCFCFSLMFFPLIWVAFSNPFLRFIFALADQLTFSINPLIPVFSQVWPEGFQSILTEVNREVSAFFPVTYDQLGWEGPPHLASGWLTGWLVDFFFLALFEWLLGPCGSWKALLLLPLPFLAWCLRP